MPLYISEGEVGELLTMAEAIDAVEGSFERLARGEAVNRPRERLPMPNGALALMACVDRGLGYAGVKSYAATSAGASFVVVLFSLADGSTAAVIEANTLGRLRTGAASGVAAARLARRGAETLGVIGCGFQAASQIAAMREAVSTLREVIVYCRNREHLEGFCESHDCVPAETYSDAGGCDIVVTATTSRDPVLRGEWLRPGALVCAMGANRRAARELDNVVLERASFVCCDSREQARSESGDLVEPVEVGVLDWLEVHELQDVVVGELRGRESDDDIVLFKSNGIAAWDVAAGVRVLELARAGGAGREL